jgi:23S rRNA pseudouridine1911/1915/1917 synthase
LVYAPVLGTGTRKGLRVRVSPAAQRKINSLCEFITLLSHKEMKILHIEKNNTNQRIDKFLKKEVFFNEEISRGEIIRNIKAGNIQVNGKTIKPSYILREDDAVISNIKDQISKTIPNDKIKIKIIYQDKNIIAINKLAGISVHPVKSDNMSDHGASPNSTLVNGLLYQFPEIGSVGDDPEIRPGIVHRLDKDTSGIMVVARNQKAFEALKGKFKNREIEKKYLALVHGKMENKAGIIEKSIARSSDYKKQIIAGRKTRTKIRPAVTEYKVIKEFRDYSIIEVSPKTGRMHQIRVHMKSIGHPVLGDKLYRLKNEKNALDAERQMLHAKSISFELFGKKYSFEAELPEDFGAFLKRS